MTKFVLMGASGNLGGVAADFAIELAALDVAKELGVKRFCYTSGAGAGVKAEKEEDIPYLLRDHHFIEQLIYASGLEYNTSLVFVGTFSLLYGVAASDNISVVKTQRLHWRVLPAMS
ncbi:unnamed protein product [Phytophthora lilii]|uniref:Unnamed protein product n=1 Tax=Phytophthora lilii TaxID=2077276 RepID=A0A9W6TN21_9STRA|nr:unnamed protein product [Phytophthora lilii]